MSRCWTRLAFSIWPRSSCCGVATVLTDSGTETWGDEISLWGDKSDISTFGGALRRITMGMTGLGLTLRILSGCSTDVVATSEIDVEVLAVRFEALSGELVIRFRSKHAAPKEKRKETRNITIVPTIQTLASASIGSGDIVRPASLTLRPARKRIRAPIYARCHSKFQPSGKNLFLAK